MEDGHENTKLHFELRNHLILTEKGKHLLEFSEYLPVILKTVMIQYNSQLAPNFHDYLEILYICEGNGHFYIANNSYNVKPNDIFIISNVEMHTLEADYKDPIKMIALFFLPELIYNFGSSPIDYSYLKPFYSNHKLYNDEICKCKISEIIHKHITDILNKYEYRPSHFQVAVKTQIINILYALLNARGEIDEDHIEIYNRRVHDIYRLKPVFQFIKKNYCSEISLSAVSNIACMSEYYFCRFFKNVTGKTFTEYITNIRIDRAKFLLAEGNLSCSEIAFNIGFKNYTYFYRCFKKLTRLSPNDYIIKNKESVNSSLRKMIINEI